MVLSLCLFSLCKSINANYLITEAFYKKKLRNQAVHEFDLNMDRQVCVIKAVAYSLRTDRHTHATRHMDRQKFKN